MFKVRGFQAPGCAQDLFVTEADKIVKLPDDFLPEQGAFVEPVAAFGTFHSDWAQDYMKDATVEAIRLGWRQF